VTLRSAWCKYKDYKTLFDFWQEQEICLFSRVFQGALGLTQSSVLCILRYYFNGKMQQGHEYDHSPQSSAEVKKVSSYVSALPYALNGTVLNYAKGRV